MMSKDGVREFKRVSRVEYGPGGSGTKSYKRFWGVDFNIGPSFGENDLLNLIEHSAYQKVVEERDALSKALEHQGKTLKTLSKSYAEVLIKYKELTKK